jgi:hypothetical protein
MLQTTTIPSNTEQTISRRSFSPKKAAAKPVSKPAKAKRARKPKPVLVVENADRLKQTLLELSRAEENRYFQSVLLAAATAVRETTHGVNPNSARNKIVKLFQEFTSLEMDDLTDETKLAEADIRKVLAKLVDENLIVEGKRRRWQEAGKHYNELWEWIGE